jgi:hypothetical protein
MSVTCTVCCEAFTSKLRTRVECPSCHYGACTRCHKTFLLSSASDPSCMNCGLHWNRAFLDEHFTPTWRNGDLKKHRAVVLFERERSLLPAAQPHVEREAQLRALRGAKDVAFAAYRASLAAAQRAREAWQDAVEALQSFDHNHVVEERRSFVAACPSDACKGFLSTQYKCGTCLKQFCSACRELKAEHHVCDPDVVASIKAILNDSRACPGCGMPINRVSGCDQMYCTLCDVPFSYSTGQRIQGVIHNPHYFERLRQLREKAGAAGEAAAQDMQEECGRWPEIWQFRWITGGDRAILTSLHQTAVNLQQHVFPQMARFARRRDDNLDLRVRYCLDELPEERFKMLLEQRERKRDLEVDVREALQLFVLLSLEMAYRLRALEGSQDRLDQSSKVLAEHLLRVEDLVNKPLRDIGKRFKKKVPIVEFPEIWSRDHKDLLLLPQWLDYNPRRRR